MIAQKVNIGLNLLRIWLSFEVVVDHFGKNYGVFPDCPITRFIRYAGGVAVPCFFVMTFFLTAGRFASRDGGWLRKRFSRLLVSSLSDAPASHCILPVFNKPFALV